MKDSESKMEMYSNLPQLFRLINALSEEQQLSLLHQLLKGNLKRHLFKAVIDLSDVQQLNLLSQLEKLPFSEPNSQTLSLDDDESSMRGHRRKRCLIRVTYSTQDQSFNDYILDISAVGVFIETDHDFSVGQDMILTFKLPNYQQPLKLDAAVAWIGNKGIGIKFKDLSPYQEEIIQSFIEKEENI
jgi:Tfp pilus assembly protein PilZ